MQKSCVQKWVRIFENIHVINLFIVCIVVNPRISKFLPAVKCEPLQ